MRLLSNTAAVFLVLGLSTSNCSAFTVVPTNTKGASSLVKLSNSRNSNEIANDRRTFFSQAVTAAGGIASAAFLPLMEPANAFGDKLKNINLKLKGYGFPTITNVPDGFTPLLELYGKGKNRSPLLVQFNYPLDWVVTLPNNDVNGEDGTIQVGQYSKGDTATLYIWPDEGKVEKLAEQPKQFFQDAIIKAISQKGDNIYQNFKIKAVNPTKRSENGQDYIIVDFKYELLTGAGFEVDRVGVAAITNEGPDVQVLWAASTRQRFKKTEPQLREITSSFRCYSEGLQLSSSIRDKLDDDF
mmetsp:Transcript_16968/g.24870  ORF Transcript_16968/g.24870 Transcript_16968/m.24870 type:complete len:299 (-) Transcript_16968:426-1322(-)|eukprot:CAMPEP_0195510158 /NCGR_PEP_ID=MMETSP0794_2-20130614/2892_1 /TAXON_ID=515487 /ORGANISM="Stephanopyxis turris, Strain CCMP 815" /LENGTH=298 /DNA_ID=CAMNT_0040637533 /DNA_START=47 /DNA_END=943 /DNA_ORIENTATION=+